MFILASNKSLENLKRIFFVNVWFKCLNSTNIEREKFRINFAGLGLELVQIHGFKIYFMCIFISSHRDRNKYTHQVCVCTYLHIYVFPNIIHWESLRATWQLNSKVHTKHPELSCNAIPRSPAPCRDHWSQGGGKYQTSLEHHTVSESRKHSKNDGGMWKGHRANLMERPLAKLRM